MIAISSWAVWAIVGHLANGGAFIIDKMLLRKSFSRPATYAGIVGLIGVFGFFLLPFVGPVGSAIAWGWIIVSGASFVISLLLFFAALASGEASRVVPVIGSLIPILTLIGTWSLLGERLSGTQAAGFLLLIVATIILSGGSAKSKLTARTVWTAVAAAAMFAVSFIAGKASYEAVGFLTAFAYARIAGAFAAVMLLSADPSALNEVRRAVFPHRTRSRSNGKRNNAAVLVLVGQGMGALGFVLVQYATSIGSAAIVNALQAVQYAFLVLVAFALAKRAPRLLNEDLTANTIIRKSIAILFVAAGLWFVV
jgi:uncharacterized membrane protein